MTELIALRQIHVMCSLHVCRSEGGGMPTVLADVRSSLNLTNACIMDSDEDTVTFAIKLPRSIIKANHHFLMAASEAASDFRPSPMPARVAQVTHRARGALKKLPLLLVYAASLCVLSIVGAWTYYAIFPATDYKTLIPDKPVVAVGEPLILMIEARHNRICQPTFDYTVKPEGSGQIVYNIRFPGRHVTVDDSYQTFTAAVNLPQLTPGKYALYIMGDFDCGSLDDHTRHISTIHFTVTE